MSVKMNTKYFVPVIAILLVVAVSGCLEGFPGFKSFFGPTQPAVEQSPDIIITKDLKTIPTPPVTADNDFTLYFTLKNQDVSQIIKNVDVKLYNWGICTPVAVDFLPEPELWEAKTGYYTRTFDELGPNVEQVIEWPFTAPTNQRIGNIEADCPIKWEVDYKFSSRSQDDFTTISKAKKSELDRAGQAWTGTDNPQYVGIGPIKIYYEFKTPMPVQSGSTVQFSVKVVDKGTGIYPKIDKGTMFIKVPKEWAMTVDDANASCVPNFELLKVESTSGLTAGTHYVNLITAMAVDAKVEDGYVIYVNNRDINLHERETSEVVCTFKAPNLDNPDGDDKTSDMIPEKSYFLSANITDYTYRLTQEQSIHIVPSV